MPVYGVLYNILYILCICMYVRRRRKGRSRARIIYRPDNSHMDVPEGCLSSSDNEAFTAYKSLC
jgi:hypothetical protein